ncbi:GIN domain-containing protein [Microbacterium sp. LWH12-1.2]|uniref:GIN domain-containing protein n=1 Tax=Microbacterium sp. LWH12-1.2 TaxID=3135259 RepID=UPI0034349E4C
MRSRLLVLSAAVLLIGSALTGCTSFGAGPRVTESLTIDDVSAVELDTGGSLHITLGNAPSLTVTAGAKVIDLLTAEVSAGVLRLGTQGEFFEYLGEIRYDLTVTSLTSLSVLGSGDATADFAGASDPIILVKGSGSVDATGIDGQTASLTVDGSGSIAAEAAVRALTARIDGSGGISINGSTTDQIVEIRGAGGYEALELQSANTRIVTRGAGDAELLVSDTLDVIIDGSGDVEYAGDPRVTKSISGSGDLVRR